MYGLREAGIIAFKQLFRKLAPAGYHPCKQTPGLWTHTTKRTIFTLCVDDFGVKYFGKTDAGHLIAAIKEHYDVTIDWASIRYYGLTLDWHYTATPRPYVDVSMPDYVQKSRERFGHQAPERPQHSPHKWTKPVFGKRTPQAPITNTTGEYLDKKYTKRIQ